MTDRIGIFIDGPNFHGACKLIGLNPDFGKLLTYFSPVAAVYAVALKPAGEHDPVFKLTSWLGYNGYRILTKPIKTIEGVMKANMDIEIALEMVQLADGLDHLVLFSGDGDFTALIRFLQLRGKRVTIVSNLTHTADELRRQADMFVDLGTLKPMIQRQEAA
jgi:uncharacterized LabA/DUF88 family protein